MTSTSFITGEPIPEPELPSSTEILESLTGFDEIAIEKAFGASIGDLARTNASTFSRALLFATFLHEGDKHDAARKRALDLTIGQVNASMRDEDEDDDELPGSEVGKDDG